MRQKRNLSRLNNARDIKSMNSKKGGARQVKKQSPAGRPIKRIERKPVNKPARHGIESKFLVIGIVIAVVIIAAIVTAILMFAKNSPLVGDETTVAPASTQAEQKQQIEVEQGLVEYAEAFAVAFSDPQVNGTSEAIISAKLLSEKAPDDVYTFKITDEDEFLLEDKASVLEDGIYIKATGLMPDTFYSVVAIKQTGDGQIENAEQILGFDTPKRNTSIADIEKLLADTCGRTVAALSKDDQILFESQAAMQLLGMDIDIYGRMEALTQVNQVMLDYSFNSVDNFVFWNHINETPTKESLALLKDVLSVNKAISKAQIIKPFTVSPYSMTKYIKYDSHGGQISSEDYILDMMRYDDDGQNGQAYFVEYPYVVDTPEFQTKYENLINGNLDADSDEYKQLKKEFGKETFELEGDALFEAIAAKNKVLYAKYCDWWLEEVAILEEKRIYLYSESGRHSMDSMLAPTMVAFAYMYDDYKNTTGNDLTVNNSYRSGDVQWNKYSKKHGVSAVLEWSGKWHKERQLVSYVPGYSNHQFAVAVDFQPAQYAFINSQAYAYLAKNGAKYGLYNYALEPWHWTYLGKEIEQSVVDATPLEPPLPAE
jgi:hypothetical protein